MEHAKNTKLNDAVTKRQFERFLPNAELPPRWKGKVKTLNDVIILPIIIQDKLFAEGYIQGFFFLAI